MRKAGQQTGSGGDGSDRALARAVLCRALRTGLERPGRGTAAAFFSAPGRRTLLRAAALCDETAALRAVVERICFVEGAVPELLSPLHERIFAHTLRGLVCPYECEYGRREALQQAQELADLAGFYAAFGLRLDPGTHERVDHVGCELQFLEFLSRKESWALERGDEEMVRITRRAVRRFLAEHLGRFGRAFACALQAAGERGFYSRLGALLETFLLVECRRCGVAIGPEVLELREPQEDPAPMACGGDDMVQIGEVSPAARALRSRR